VQSRMRSVGLDEDKQRADYILNADEACDVALEFGFNPTVDDEASFDILPE
jgi:translation initiation factor IF-2